MRHLHTAQRIRCATPSSSTLHVQSASWSGPERSADINEFAATTWHILRYDAACALAVDDEECSIQDVARMCFLLQRWREHGDLLRAIEETFPASGVDPIASSLAQLQDPAIAKTLRLFVAAELGAFTDLAKPEETSAMGCITWSWYMLQNLRDAVDNLLPRGRLAAA